jgi:hypothetical protein
MRRIQEAVCAAQRAIDSESEEEAADEWRKVFGDLWPAEEDIKQEARMEATRVWPGQATITQSGGVIGYEAATKIITTRPTTFHGS